MSIEEFSELSDRIYQLYLEGKYAPALEAATQASGAPR